MCQMHLIAVFIFILLIWAFASRRSLWAGQVHIGVFDVDASPPVGSPLAYDPATAVQTPLSCRGIVILGAGEPIVICVVDWLGIGNDGQKEFKAALANAVGTSPRRVAVHTMHPHDAPRCDLSAIRILGEHGLETDIIDAPFIRDVIRRAAAGAGLAVRNAKPITHLGLGAAKVEKVASNRRILGPNGKLVAMRFSKTCEAALQDAPEGTIDPELKMISFWNGDQAVAVLTYYATHPQSYYRTGLANPDFVGMARNERQSTTGAPHIHFNGAGGNVAAGKYNDGSHEMRQVLADRVALAMKLAWECTRKKPLAAEDVDWALEPVALPRAKHLDEAKLVSIIKDDAADTRAKTLAAIALGWLLRSKRGEMIDIACLKLGDARALFMPGELFVEYQLAAQAMRQDRFVAMAAYGDYAPGYIGTAGAYDEGGYETMDAQSRVSPDVEEVLMSAMRKLLAQ